MNRSCNSVPGTGNAENENLGERRNKEILYEAYRDIRQYLENRFGVYSLELTTSETLDALVKTGFKKDETYSRLKSVLTEADLVKFAKYNPEPAENESSFNNAWEFVSATRLDELLQTQLKGTIKKVRKCMNRITFADPLFLYLLAGCTGDDSFLHPKTAEKLLLLSDVPGLQPFEKTGTDIQNLSEAYSFRLKNPCNGSSNYSPCTASDVQITTRMFQLKESI